MKNIIIISTPTGHKYVRIKYNGHGKYTLKIVSKLQKATIFGGNNSYRICKAICDELVKKLTYEKSKIEDMAVKFENPYAPRPLNPAVNIDYPMYQFRVYTDDNQTNEEIIVVPKHQLEKLIPRFPFIKPINKKDFLIEIYIDDIDHYIEDIMDEF